MKKTAKLLTAGAVAALAAAGAAAYKKYMESYNQVETETEDEDSDFVPMQYIDDDDFEYVIEDEDQIMFDE